MEIVATKPDDMETRCGERINHIEQAASKAHSRIDEQKRFILCLNAWRNRQIGALIILSIIAERA